MQKDHPTSIVPALQFLAQAPAVLSSATSKAHSHPAVPELVHVDGDGAEQSPPLPPPSSSVRVLLYSGEQDLNCNTLGTLHTLEANSWRGRWVS